MSPTTGPQGSAVPAATTPPRPASAAPTASLVRKRGLSIWWLIIPTAVYGLLQVVLAAQKDVVSVVVAVAAAGGLYWWRQQPVAPTLPPALQRVHPYAYALQPGVIFVMLGGVSAGVALGIVIFVVLWVAKNPQKAMAQLEPWWAYQEKLSANVRKLLVVVVTGIIGFVIGSRASGIEWGATLISVCLGMVATFLLLFTPPSSLRQRKT